MRIMHINLGCFYIDNYGYQENILPYYNKKHGHDVEIIASTFTYIDNIKKGYVNPSSYLNEHHIKVTRLRYKRYLPHIVMRKIRDYHGLWNAINLFEPDIIFVHGFQSLSIRTVVKYKKKHKSVILYADTHADYYTSGTNFISLKLLHGVFYKKLILNNLRHFKKIFYISINCGQFLHEVYKVPNKLTEFYSLGGTIKNPIEQKKNRMMWRNQMKYSISDIILLQAGKIDFKKKLIESLQAFMKFQNNNFKYVIAGSLDSSIADIVTKYSKIDDRIKYIGWQNNIELNIILDSCDVYIQPGKPSAIMQNALCSGCPVISNNLVDYEPFVNGNGWLIDSPDDITSILETISIRPEILLTMRQKSLKIALKLLDYEMLAKKIYK